MGEHLFCRSLPSKLPHPCQLKLQQSPHEHQQSSLDPCSCTADAATQDNPAVACSGKHGTIGSVLTPSPSSDSQSEPLSVLSVAHAGPAGQKLSMHRLMAGPCLRAKQLAASCDAMCYFDARRQLHLLSWTCVFCACAMLLFSCERTADYADQHDTHIHIFPAGMPVQHSLDAATNYISRLPSA